MRRETFSRSSTMFVVFAVASFWLPMIALARQAARSDASDMMRLGLRGVYFVPNQGQWSDAKVHYGLRARGLDVAFRESAFTIHMSRGLDEEASAAPANLTLTVTFPGSHQVQPFGAEMQLAKFNYFVVGEGRSSASDVPSFGEVVYANLYDGIDLHVMGNDDGVLKYEFHVLPGADYTQIHIAYDGSQSLCIDDGGSLHIGTSFGTLRDCAPEVWQEAGDSRTNIPARFDLVDDRTYRISLDGPVDLTLPLIIDPEIEWMYYLGESGNDDGAAIVVDTAGNALIVGDTDSTDFTGRNNSFHGGDFDAFVLKVSPSGQILWMTYLGGSGTEEGFGIAVDGAGNALVTGWTDSPDFVGRDNSFHGGSEDAFALKVSPSGQLLWMTYLGGVSTEIGHGVAVDEAGNALVTGPTASPDFAGRNNSYHGGSNDAFALKVSPSGQLLWMTYLGGSNQDGGLGVTADGTGNALVTGHSASTDFAGRNNSFHGGDSDAFALSVNPSGQVLWMTYLGGSRRDVGGGIAVDGAGNALVTGATASTNFSGRNNLYQGGAYDTFALRVSASGQLLWMTYLGGSNGDVGGDVTVDTAGNALISGETASTDFAGRNNAYHGGEVDAFVLSVSASGEIRWMTYLGGSGTDAGDGHAVDGAGNVLITGETVSTDFGGRNNSYHGGDDAFIIKLRIADGPQLSAIATCPSGGPIQISWTGATPGGTVVLLYARNTGAFRIPNGNPCAGTQLGLGSNQLQIGYQGSAGQNGSRTVNANAGPGACGGYMQLLDVSTCATSNVVIVE